MTWPVLADKGVLSVRDRATHALAGKHPNPSLIVGSLSSPCDTESCGERCETASLGVPGARSCLAHKAPPSRRLDGTVVSDARPRAAHHAGRGLAGGLRRLRQQLDCSVPAAASGAPGIHPSPRGRVGSQLRRTGPCAARVLVCPAPHLSRPVSQAPLIPLAYASSWISATLPSPSSPDLLVRDWPGLLPSRGRDVCVRTPLPTRSLSRPCRGAVGVGRLLASEAPPQRAHPPGPLPAAAGGW